MSHSEAAEWWRGFDPTASKPEERALARRDTEVMVPQILFSARQAIGFDTAPPANRFSNVRACCPSVELGKLSGREQNTRWRGELDER